MYLTCWHCNIEFRDIRSDYHELMDIIDKRDRCPECFGVVRSNSS